MNRYRSPYSDIVGTSGQMYNEATKTERVINYNHYGICVNDNTYAVTFNPYINRPPTTVTQQDVIKLPRHNEHITKTYNEPPAGFTENNVYIASASVESPPLLPPYLNEPLEEVIQGKTDAEDSALYTPSFTNSK